MNFKFGPEDPSPSDRLDDDFEFGKVKASTELSARTIKQIAMVVAAIDGIFSVLCEECCYTHNKV